LVSCELWPEPWLIVFRFDRVVTLSPSVGIVDEISVMLDADIERSTILSGDYANQR
jgi:hypothetical protein